MALLGVRHTHADGRRLDPDAQRAVFERAPPSRPYGNGPSSRTENFRPWVMVTIDDLSGS